MICSIKTWLHCYHVSGDNNDASHTSDSDQGGNTATAPGELRLPGAQQQPVPGHQHRVQAAHQEGEGEHLVEICQETGSQ